MSRSCWSLPSEGPPSLVFTFLQGAFPLPPRGPLGCLLPTFYPTQCGSHHLSSPVSSALPLLLCSHCPHLTNPSGAPVLPPLRACTPRECRVAPGTALPSHSGRFPAPRIACSHIVSSLLPCSLPKPLTPLLCLRGEPTAPPAENHQVGGLVLHHQAASCLPHTPPAPPTLRAEASPPPMCPIHAPYPQSFPLNGFLSGLNSISPTLKHSGKPAKRHSSFSWPA